MPEQKGLSAKPIIIMSDYVVYDYSHIQSYFLRCATVPFAFKLYMVHTFVS